MPTRCNRFLLKILLLAQHVSGTTMPISWGLCVRFAGCCSNCNNSMGKSVSVGDTLPHTVVGVSLWWISADGTFSPTRNLITMRCSTLRGTFFSLITLATPRQDWRGSNPSRREGGGCGFTLSRSHSCCAVLLVYIQISPGYIWTTFYIYIYNKICQQKFQPLCCDSQCPNIKDKSLCLVQHKTKRWKRTDSQGQHCTIRQ